MIVVAEVHELMVPPVPQVTSAAVIAMVWAVLTKPAALLAVPLPIFRKPAAAPREIAVSTVADISPTLLVNPNVVEMNWSVGRTPIPVCPESTRTYSPVVR